MEKGDYAIQISKYPHVVKIIETGQDSYWVVENQESGLQDAVNIPASDLKKLERRTLKERKVLAAKIPWVSKLNHQAACTAWTSRGTLCSRNAEFHFKRHKDSDTYVVNANYCWTHLIYQGLMADMTEEARTHAWERKQFFASLEADRAPQHAASQSL